MRFISNKTIYRSANLLRKWGFKFNELNDPRVILMRNKINELGKIEFKIEQYPDGSWVAESTNLEGVITGGNDIREVVAMEKDAVFTYFGIPPHLCVDDLLKADNEPVTVMQNVYVQS